MLFRVWTLECFFQILCGSQKVETLYFGIIGARMSASNKEQPVSHCAVLHATKVTIRILSASSFNFARGNVVCYVIWDCFIDN